MAQIYRIPIRTLFYIRQLFQIDSITHHLDESEFVFEEDLIDLELAEWGFGYIIWG